jgi:hypothetical protein
MAIGPFRLGVALLVVAWWAPPAAAAGTRAEAPPEGGSPPAGHITVSLDLTPAADILAVFHRHGAAPEELAALLARPEVRALIAQTARFDAAATPEAFRNTLQLAAAGRLKADAPDPFAFSRVRQRAADIGRLYDLIEARAPALQRDIAARLQPDLPAGVDLNVHAAFVVGGTSDGWAQPANQLYLALQSFEGDYDGLVTLMAHEVYHVVQYSVMPATGSAAADSRQRNAENLMIATLMEGTASFVGDPTQAAGGGTYLEWYRGRYRTNLGRIQDDFALFDALLFRAAHDGEVDYRELYSLGFSGAWGSPLDFVGYRMAQVIARYGGRSKVAAYLNQPAGSFFADYIAACDAHPGESLCVRFDSQTTHTLLQVRDRTITAGANRARLFLL